MSVPLTKAELEIATSKLVAYLTWRNLLVLVPLLILLILTTLAGYPNISIANWLITGVALVLLLGLGLVWPRMHVNALHYALDRSTLCINEGIVFRKQKSIPLDRMTDVVLVQGPLMRLFGIWALQIQTAGGAQQRPEGALHGLVEPHMKRDSIMEARDRAARWANGLGC